jgi:protocatechuate 3,4-dioxygenase beta subunit
VKPAGACLVVLFTLSAAAQTPRPAAPSSPTSGAAGATAPTPANKVSTADEYSAVIRGRVVRADTGEPVRQVRVSLSTGQGHLAVTDDEGRYELKAVPAGRYYLAASKGGFIAVRPDRTSQIESQRPIDVGRGQVFERVDFTLQRGGVIAGVVLDDLGEPLPGASVELLRQRYESGVRRLAPLGRSEPTDDLGRFRLFAIAPGTYYLSAAPSDQFDRQRFGSTTTLYPGTLSASEAKAIEVGPGQEISGLTFPLLTAKLATLQVVVQASDGRPASNASVNVESTESGRLSGIVSDRRPDGSFAIADLSPGEYVLSARTSSEMTVARVVLDGADAFLTVTLTKGHAIRGRVTMEGATSMPPLPSNFGVRAESALASTSFRATRIRDDWTFEVAGLAGPHRLSVVLPDGWAARRILYNGTNIIDAEIDLKGADLNGIEVTVTNRLTAVTGLVGDDRGRPVTGAKVVFFAEDPGRWRPRTRYLKTGQVDQNGRYDIRGLPPARYLAVAVEDLEPGEETNPETLERLARAASRVTLAEGQPASLNLRLLR